MSLHQINTDLLEIEKAFDDLKKKYPGIAREFASARVNYELANMKAISDIAHEVFVRQQTDPKYKMIEVEKTAEALLRTGELYRKYRESEAERDGQKMLADINQSQLTSIQTRTKIEMSDDNLINAQVL